MFAVCLICVEYFYRAEKGVRAASGAECMDLAFAPQIHYGHSCSLTESHSIYFLCACLTWSKNLAEQKENPRTSYRKMRETNLSAWTMLWLTVCFFQAKCSKIVTVKKKKKVPCALLVCEKYYIDCTSFEGPQFPLSIMFSEQLCSLFCIYFFFLVVGLTGSAATFHQAVLILLRQNRMLLQW